MEEKERKLIFRKNFRGELYEEFPTCILVEKSKVALVAMVENGKVALLAMVGKVLNIPEVVACGN